MRKMLMGSAVFAAFAAQALWAGTPVVFLHGWNSDGGIWKPMQKLLVSDAGYVKEDFHTYSYYELESGFDTDTPIETLAAAVAARIAEDVPEGRFDVIAHSMGGLVLRAAICGGLIDPDRVGHFITLGTPHYGELIGIPGVSAGTETHQMALGSSFLWDLAYDWHFLRNRVGKTLCIVGVAGKDPITDSLYDGLVPAFSAVLADSDRLYVKRYHADLFSWFGKVIYACEDGAKDSVYQAVKSFLLEDRALTQSDIGWNPDSAATSRGALFYRVTETAGGESLAYDKDESRIAREFTNRFTGKRTASDAYFHGGKGWYGAPLGLEMTLGDLKEAVYDVKLATPDGTAFTVADVPVVGGRVGLMDLGADGSRTDDGLYPTPEPPKETLFWKKATTVSVACDSGSGYVGIGQVKIGKMGKTGTVKVSATFTPFGGKKVSAKSKTCAVAEDGSFEVEWPEVKGLGRVALEVAPVEGGAEISGSFAEFAVSAAKVGGELPVAEFEFALGDVVDGELPPGTVTELLPTSVVAAVSGGKWRFAKAAKVKWSKIKGSNPAEYELAVDTSKDRTNLSGLSVSYTPKTGVLKGSFKVYALVESRGRIKLKKYGATLAGAVIDGTGRGTATVKSPHCVWTVSITE